MENKQKEREKKKRDIINEKEGKLCKDREGERENVKERE